MAALIAGLVLLAAVAAAYGEDYVVGDSSGWSSGVDYTTWAKGKAFSVGDTLVFQYSMMHTVAEVSSADYSACSASNSIQSYSNQNTKVALTAPGTRYFICGTPSHCGNGMKLAVTVSPAAVTTPASPPDAPSATPATPSAPGTETPSEETTPSTSTPAATTAPTTKSTSDSTAAASGGEARLVTSLLGGAAGLVGLALLG
ncbi:uclacyanin-3-like [Phragmites australis]|uniref:uclacyanin-3-like n=1 Tax=Phragmites australis TaxID=29695 RepID=UPI002D78E290|nr:uclacyanin-3-like [Phragmites australis]